MSGLQPPDVPVFYPGPIASVPDQWNQGVNTPVGTAGGVAGTNNFMGNRPKFKARRTAAQTTATGHQFIVWDTIVQDTEGGGSSGSSIYNVKVAGWYMATARVSLASSGAGASGLVLIPAIAVNGTSPTSIGSNGWEGPEVPPPTAASSPKISNGVWIFYARTGDQVQLDMWYSSESTLTATDTTTGRWPSLSLVWWGK